MTPEIAARADGGGAGTHTGRLTTAGAIYKNLSFTFCVLLSVFLLRIHHRRGYSGDYNDCCCVFGIPLSPIIIV